MQTRTKKDRAKRGLQVGTSFQKCIFRRKKHLRQEGAKKAQPFVAAHAATTDELHPQLSEAEIEAALRHCFLLWARKALLVEARSS